MKILMYCFDLILIIIICLPSETSTSQLDELFINNECGRKVLHENSPYTSNEETQRVLAIKLTNCLLTEEGAPPIYYKVGMTGKEALSQVQDLKITNLYGEIQSLLVDGVPEDTTMHGSPTCLADSRIIEKIERREERMENATQQAEKDLTQTVKAPIAETLLKYTVPTLISMMSLIEISPCSWALLFYSCAVGFYYLISNFPQFSSSKLFVFFTILVNFGFECVIYYLWKPVIDRISVQIFCSLVMILRILSFVICLRFLFRSFTSYGEPMVRNRGLEIAARRNPRNEDDIDHDLDDNDADNVEQEGRASIRSV